MQVWIIAMVVTVCGGVGGFVNAFLTGGLHLPRRTAYTYAPGWIPKVAIGAVAAIAFWSLYDHSSRVAVIAVDSSHAKGILTMAEVVASIAVGIGAAHLLASEKKRVVI